MKLAEHLYKRVEVDGRATYVDGRLEEFMVISFEPVGRVTEAHNAPVVDLQRLLREVG